MKKQRHFKSDRAIKAAIFETQRKQNAKLAEAQKSDAKADVLKQLSLERALSDEEVEQLGWERKQAQKARESANRLESTVNKLRATLAAFQTETLPGIVSGNDVVIQR